ncbi:MAG: AAA domain-containing protein [Crocinitomicaceae bacterium]
MEELIEQSDIKSVLNQFQSQLYDISARNPFVNVKPEKLLILSDLGIDYTTAEKIRTKQKFYLKEYGLETSLKINLFIKWKQPNKDQFFLSPLLYQPCAIQKNQKIELQYKIKVQNEDCWQVNPILNHLFKKHFHFQFNQEYPSAEAVINHLKAEFNSKNNIFQEADFFDETDNWQLIPVNAVGTFNYQKSMLAKDFERIKQSPNLLIKQILGFENFKQHPEGTGRLDWFPLDSSQKKVLRFASSNSTVIQGPPGTGKSHTIVASIQHYVAQGKKVLFVSEKKSALDVVYSRLAELKSSAAYFDAEKNSKRSFYKSLKNAYNKADTAESIDLNLDEISLLKSKIYPSVCRIVDEYSGVSIAKLEKELLKNKSKLIEKHAHSTIPKYRTWEELQSDLQKIETFAVADWHLKSIGDSLALHLNKALFLEQNPLVKIDRKIDELINKVTFIARIQSEYQLSLNWIEFSKLCLSASILNMVDHNQVDLLLNNSKTSKTFNSLAKRYQTIKNRLNTIILKNTAWKNRPSLSAIEAHEIILSKTGFLSMLKAKRSHNRLFNNYNEKVSFDAGVEILHRLKQEYDLTEKLHDIEIKLKHSSGIFNPTTEIDFILTVRQKLQSVSHNHYQVILEHNEYEELIELLADQHKVISSVNRIKQFLFNGQMPENINEFVAFLTKLKKQLNRYQNTVSELETVLNLPFQVINFIRLNKCSVSQLTKLVLQNELNKALKYQTHLLNLSGKELMRRSLAINQLKDRNYKLICKGIYRNSLKSWNNIEKLCATPHSKLSDFEKKKKVEYKKAIRIVVHEMNKTRQLMPVKELFEKCDQLITALLPVWILNPLAIAERLPLHAELFDVVIFDESSQIPFEDALPAIFRAKQIIVVGDSKQMPPSQFFSANKQSPSLLDEAEKFLPTKSLLWHYRSEHPNLISFSNQQFYDNELKLFPAWEKYDPVVHHYIVNGSFEDSKNQKEAIAIVERYRELTDKGETDIAIIALSKEQEKCIRKYIVKKGVDLPESVVLRNLESVQGIEKKIVLISIGYAKNNEGKLNLNFGPINKEQGGNRLNVLFSRAITSMEVFTSITPQDIGLSENKGLTILRQFLQFSSEKKAIKKLTSNDFLTNEIRQFLLDNKIAHYFDAEQSGIIIDCFLTDKKDKILLVNPGLNTKDDIEVSSIISVLNLRFKAVKIVLNADWMKNEANTKKEISDFLIT